VLCHAYNQRVTITTGPISPSKRETFTNKASTADVYVRGSHGYAADVADLRYLDGLGLPVGQIAVRMARSPEAVSRMLASAH
jgi:hypothetical protein